jgi:hypothetical protein
MSRRPHPAYIEYGRVPARPEKDEPSHYYLDIGYAFVTAHAEVGRIQQSEVTGANWYSVVQAERLVGRRIARAISAGSHRLRPHAFREGLANPTVR